MSKGFNLSEWAVTHRSLTLFFLLLFTAAGVLAYATLGLKEEPEFKFKLMVIRVLWPGATAEEIEQQVTDRIERKLQDTPHLDYVRSYSRPGESVIFVNLLGSTRAFDVDYTWYQVRKKVADIRAQLPAGVIGPFFNDEFGDTYSNIYALSGEGFGYAEIKTYADLLRAEILRVPASRRRTCSGCRTRRSGSSSRTRSSPRSASTRRACSRRSGSRTRW
jgi:multidrug efflux pump